MVNRVRDEECSKLIELGIIDFPDEYDPSRDYYTESIVDENFNYHKDMDTNLKKMIVDNDILFE